MPNRYFFLILLLMIVWGCSSKPSRTESSILVDVTATELTKTLNSYQGQKPVLLNVWATWCIPCVEEFPYLMQLNEKYAGKFELVLISGDFEEERSAAEAFLKQHQVDFTTYFKQGNDNEFISTLSKNWTGALPYTMVLDANGKVIKEWEGAADYETFEQALLKALNNTES